MHCVQAGARGAAGGDLNGKLEVLHKQCKLAIEVSDQRSIAHCKHMIHLLEEKEAREMDGGGADIN